MTILRLVLTSLILSCFPLHASAGKLDPSDPLDICAEDTGWPPFSYPPESAGQAFHGFNMDLLDRIFAGTGMLLKIHIRPWKRCLYDGMNGDIDLVLDAAGSPERESHYLLTRPIYHLTPAYFFARDGKYDYSRIRTMKDLKADVQLCGQSGYNYTNFGIDIQRVREVSKSLKTLAEVIVSGGCDISLTREEVWRTELRNTTLQEQLIIHPVPGAPVENFYWMLNRNHANAPALKKHIDQQVEKLYRSGEAARLLRAYFQ